MKRDLIKNPSLDGIIFELKSFVSFTDYFFFLSLTLSCLHCIPRLMVEIKQSAPSLCIYPFSSTSLLPSTSPSVYLCSPPPLFLDVSCYLPSSFCRRFSPSIASLHPCPAQHWTRLMKRTTHSLSPCPDSHLISNLLDPAIPPFSSVELCGISVRVCVCVCVPSFSLTNR